MRAGPALFAVLLLGHAPGAWAQAVNQGALDALTPDKPIQLRPATPRPPQPRAPEVRPPASRTVAKPTPPTLPVPPKVVPPPAVPEAPPAIAALPPPVSVPVARPQPAPAIPVTADAPGEAARVQGGVRATFGADRSDLNPATEDALRTFARRVKGHETAAINVLAYAAGSANDPSTPRRLSLARALAARAVLMNEGIASTRIYVRALGMAGGDGPPDRVDVTSDIPGGQS